MRWRCASISGVSRVCSSVVASTSPCVSAQTSALLPPACIDAMSPLPLARRARPPGSTRQDCAPSDTANTRSMTERGTTRPAPDADCSQVGICDNGR